MSKIAYHKIEAEWKARIHNQKLSDKSIRKWCKENKLSSNAFYYWRSKLFPKEIKRSNFIELTDNKSTGITIEYREVHIHLDKDFDLLTLKSCLAALRSLRCL